MTGAHRIPSQLPRPAGFDTAVLLHTDGAAGVPKAMMLTHINLRINANQTVAWVPMLHKDEENLLCLLPFLHAFGLTLNLLCTVQKATIQVMLLKFLVDQILTTHERRPFIFFVSVSTTSERIPDGAQERGTNLGTLRYGMCGAASMPPEVGVRWEKATDGFFIEDYGTIETSSTVTGTPMGPLRRLDALGPPFPSTNVHVVNPGSPDSDREMPDGESGGLLVCGPQVFADYWEDEAATQAAILPRG